MNNNVSIIIITFNREVVLEKVLTYLMKKTEYFKEIILVIMVLLMVPFEGLEKNFLELYIVLEEFLEKKNLKYI